MENKLARRVYFATELLSNLKSIYVKLQNNSNTIEDQSVSFFKKMFNENRFEVQSEINKYNENLKEINHLNCQATQYINKWFEFSKSSHELKKLTFPIKFKIRKKQLKNDIKKINKKISDIAIENRFLKEHLLNWEKELEVKTIKEIKKDGHYTNYEDLLKTKEILINELTYLLPTIPGVCPGELDISNIDRLVNALNKEFR